MNNPKNKNKDMVTLPRQAFIDAAKQKRIDEVLAPAVLKQLRVVDEQDAINRFTWHNLPKGLNGNLIERILYYRGQGALFYMDETEQFYFLPFTLNSAEGNALDVYGRFTGISPLPFNGRTDIGDKENVWIPGLIKKPIYDLVLPTDPLDEQLNAFMNGCVLLTDYSRQISQTILPRQALNEPLLGLMSECIPFMRTALINNTGIQAMKVTNEDDESNVKAASRSVHAAALNGEPWIPIVGQIDFQQITGNASADTEQYLLAMQALDNYRLSLYGLDNGGLFQKRSHMLEAEQRMNSNNSGLIMMDGLALRKEFCLLANSIWGTYIDVTINEAISNADVNGNGMIDTGAVEPNATVEPKPEASEASEESRGDTE